MVYGHANGIDIADTITQIENYIDMGYLAIRAQTGVPGLPNSYGVSKDKIYYGPATKGLPEECVCGLRKNILIIFINYLKNYVRIMVTNLIFFMMLIIA